MNIIAGLGLGFSTCNSYGETPLESVTINVMSGFPSEEPGYVRGVSGCYAGMLGEYLVMAGGCNFPDKPVSEGGIKRFYKGIYIARVDKSSVLNWKKVGELPVEAAYGVVISLSNKLILIGGSNPSGYLSSVLSLSFDGKENSHLMCETLPSLPSALDNMSGTLLDNKLYLVGGNSDGQPSNSMFSLCLNDYSEGWKEAFIPGKPRVQPVCSTLHGNLYVWGGFSVSSDGKDASVFTDGLCYSPKTEQWKAIEAPLATTGEPLTLTGGASISYKDSFIICAGGVDRDIFLDAISGSYQKVHKSDYLLQPVEWYHFNNRLLAFNLQESKWKQIGDSSPMLARAGASLVLCGDTLFYIGGELKPGVRTPDICRILLKE